MTRIAVLSAVAGALVFTAPARADDRAVVQAFYDRVLLTLVF